jgi:hypothetical protein
MAELSPDEDGRDDASHNFHWKDGMKYWWTNRYDQARDLRTGERTQINLRHKDGNLEAAMALI